MQKTHLLHVFPLLRWRFCTVSKLYHSHHHFSVWDSSAFQAIVSFFSIAWSWCAAIYFGSKHTMFLTTEHCKGHLSNNLTVNDCRNTWHSFWYSNICLSLTFFFRKSVMSFLAANTISTSFTWSRFSFSMTSTFASFATDVTFSITLFLMNLSKMVHKMSYRYSAMKGNIGLSLWNTSRNGCSTFAIVQNNCSFAGTRRSWVTPCRNVKLWLFGIFDLGPAQIWAINTWISGHMRMALSATATSSNHLVAQNCNGNSLEVDTFI